MSKFSFILLFGMSLISSMSFADDAPTHDTAPPADQPAADPYQDNLFGNMNGWRDQLANYGATLSIDYKSDLFDVASGGLKTGGNYVDNFNATLDIDSDKALGLKDNKIQISLLSNQGNSINNRLHTVQDVDNADVPNDAFKLYEVWTEQNFTDENLSLRVGLQDLNDEFLETDMTGNFIAPEMQIGQEFAQTGANSPSIAPETAFAARIKYSPTDESYAQVAAFDAIAGDPGHPQTSSFNTNGKGGLLLIAETGLTPKSEKQTDSTPNKFAIGVWRYTKEFNDLVDVNAAGTPVQHASQGIYAISSYQFYHDEPSGRDLGAFARLGFANGDVAQTDWSYQVGLVANGWVPGRPDGEIGFGLAEAHNSSHYQQMVALAGSKSDTAEYGFDLYYRDTVTNGIHIQPDAQYIINPGTNPNVKNAAVIGIRFDMNF